MINKLVKDNFGKIQKIGTLHGDPNWPNLARLVSKQCLPGTERN